MLEVTLEIDSDIEQIKKTDILYLMSDTADSVPTTLLDLDPKRK